MLYILAAEYIFYGRTVFKYEYAFFKIPIKIINVPNEIPDIFANHALGLKFCLIHV